MATSQIQLTRSGTTGAKPAPGELALGELALNYADGKLYYKNTSSQVVDINNIYNTTNGVVYVNDVDNHVGINTTSPAFALDIGGGTASVDNTLRIHQTHEGTAIRIGAGGGGSDVTLIRVDGDSTNVSDGTSDNNEYGFSIKYLGGGSGNNNKFAIMSDDSAGDFAQLMAFQILQDGTVGMSKGTSFTHNSAVTLDVEDDIQVTGDGPTLRLHNTDGDDTHDESRISIGTDTTLNALEFQTYRSDTNAFVSNDYRILKDSNGATQHEFKIANSNRAKITNAGLGLGTDHTPQRSLDVKGSGAIIRGNLYIGDGSNSEALEAATSNMILFGTRVGSIDTLYEYSNDKIVFRVGQNNEDGEILVLDENAGSHVATLDGELDVTGDLTVTGNAIAADPTANTHLTTKSYVDTQIATAPILPTITVFQTPDTSYTASAHISNFTDEDANDNLAFAGTSLKTALPPTTGDDKGKITVPSTGVSLVEVHLQGQDNDVSSTDDFRLWVLGDNRSTSSGYYAAGVREAMSSYAYSSGVHWCGYVAPGTSFTCYIQELSGATEAHVQGSVKITTYPS